MINNLKSWLGALTLPILITLAWSPGAEAVVAVANIFKNNVVLQQQKPVNIWGTGAAGESVTVAFTRAGDPANSKTTTVAANGTWMVALNPINASFTAGTLTINSSQTITGVLVGEVYLASGQSNMQWCSADTSDPDDQPPADTNIRYYKVTTSHSGTPSTNYSSAFNWSTNGQYMSLVAYNFMKQLNTDLNVPVGWIQAPYSGTPIRTWISNSALLSTAVGQDVIATYGANTGPSGPSRAFNAMINPVFPYTVRGVIWYQGENDTEGVGPEQYKTMFPLLITSWRAAFGDPDLPFLFVQLAGYNTGQGNWANLRQAQTLTLGLQNTGMAVPIDIGDTQQIHPKDKDIVGQRLALIAKRRIYGMTSVQDEGPKFDHAEFLTGTNKVRVVFSNVGTGLTVTTARNGFKLAPASGVYVNPLITPYSATLEATGNSILIWNSTIATPEYVTYAWENRNNGLSLRNSYGLPATPFRASITQPTGPSLSTTENFRWGPGTQTGPGAIGLAGDIWNAGTTTNSAAPFSLVNTLGTATDIKLTWVCGTGGYPGNLQTGQTSQYWTPYDAATATLMTNYLRSYLYSSSQGAITANLTGLWPSTNYTLVTYAGSVNGGSTSFSMTGDNVVSAYISGTSRRISDGEGVAYATRAVRSSSTGTLNIKTTDNGSWTGINGFQLRLP